MNSIGKEIGDPMYRVDAQVLSLGMERTWVHRVKTDVDGYGEKGGQYQYGVAYDILYAANYQLNDAEQAVLATQYPDGIPIKPSRFGFQVEFFGRLHSMIGIGARVYMGWRPNYIATIEDAGSQRFFLGFGTELPLVNLRIPPGFKF
jgi:hypothetical protein